MTESTLPEESLFLQALDIGSPEEQASFLHLACGTNSELRRGVEALLRHHREGSGFLESPPTEVVVAAEQLTAREHEAPVLDFLAPGTQAESIGRLGHYEVLELLGSGGFGVVLKARDTKLDRIVAIKALAQPVVASATARLRFVREAKAAAAVNHENVVGIHAISDEGPFPYLVMECVSGVSLAEKLQQLGTLDLPAIVRIGMQIASGLAAAHQHGLMHRDIKPANILLENGVERVKITDFGLARLIDDASITQSGVVAGTPQYMSPEQARGEHLDHRSDLFSLGSVLYAMCTGRPAFGDIDGTLPTLRQICEQEPPPIRACNPSIPEWLVDVIRRLHAKDPAERFQSAAEVVAALQSEVATAPVQARSVNGSRRSWLKPAIVLSAAVLAVVGLLAAFQIVIRIRDKDNKLVEINVPPGASIEIAVGKTLPGFAANVSSSGSLRRYDGHSAGVINVAFLPGNRRFLSASRDGTLRMWDVEPGNEPVVLRGHSGAVTAAAVTGDGKYALSAGTDNTLRWWDLNAGRELRRFAGATENVNCVAISPNGRRAITGGGVAQFSEGFVRVWDTESGTVLRRFDGQFGGVIAVAFSPDGMRALSGGMDHTLRLWGVDDGREIETLEGLESYIWSVAFSADGKQALGGSGTHTPDPSGNPVCCWVRVWDVDTRKLLFRCVGHRREVTAVALVPHNQSFVSGSADGTLRLWDGQTGRERHRFQGHQGEVFSLSVPSDGKSILSASADGTVRLWEMPE